MCRHLRLLNMPPRRLSPTSFLCRQGPQTPYRKPVGLLDRVRFARFVEGSAELALTPCLSMAPRDAWHHRVGGLGHGLVMARAKPFLEPIGRSETHENRKTYKGEAISSQ